MVTVSVGESAGSRTDATTPRDGEKTPLLAGLQERPNQMEEFKKQSIPKRISAMVLRAVGLIISPVLQVGTAVLACFYHEDGHFSLIAPITYFARTFTRTRRKQDAITNKRSDDARSSYSNEKKPHRRSSSVRSDGRKVSRRTSSIASSTAILSDSDTESERPSSRDGYGDSPAHNTRSKTTALSPKQEIAPSKRTIRINLHNEEALRQRTSNRREQVGSKSRGQSTEVSAEAAALLKSPTGPVIAKQITKFPRIPQPPRPLVPRRQPSYLTTGASAIGPHQKTLVLDLDETLIHSMAKGGRYTTGHMVEVKLQQPVGAGGQLVGTQVPILYYVHKRPQCDEFLKKVG